MAADDQELVPINIGNINDGAIFEMFEREMQKVWENICDLATPATATRSLTIRVDFKPHSDRCVIETEVASGVKLATVEKHKSKVFLGKTEENSLIAFASDPRQLPLWHAPKPMEETPVISFKQAEKK
jgi:hypothetical protein